MLGNGVFNSKECLDILVSYAVAEEGTNTLYLRLIEIMVRAAQSREMASDGSESLSDYNLVEIEMILNYFPHAIWKSED
jgi:hypothetical protein